MISRFGAPFSSTPLDVATGGLVLAHAGEHDGVQGPVELAVPAPAEPVPTRVTRGSRDRTRARDLSEGALGTDPARVGPHRQNGRGRGRARTSPTGTGRARPPGRSGAAGCP